MDHSKKWRKIEYIDEGGQGKVYRVCRINNEIEDKFLKTLVEITTAIRSMSERREHLPKFIKGLGELLKAEDPSNHGALKELHKFGDSRDDNIAAERIKREIKVMSENLHPNLIKILDFDPDSKWYVSQFYENGTLAHNIDVFKGDFVKSLKAIRPLVEAVAELHKKSYVHRDIKPQNVFLNSNNDLILGDFGLIYFEDNQRTRISDKYENVGSRDWMPAWAMGMRIDDLKPNFDVFTLGKLLWAMISGKSMLRLWYFNQDEFNVENMFPNSRTIKFANPLFEKCIVENEDDCLRNAKVLLSEIDDVLKKIQMGIDMIEQKEKVAGDLSVTNEDYDEQDIIAILTSWMGSRSSSENRKAIRFEDVDRELNLKPGTSKKYIEVAAQHYDYIASRKGRHTILFRDKPPEGPYVV